MTSGAGAEWAEHDKWMGVKKMSHILGTYFPSYRYMTFTIVFEAIAIFDFAVSAGRSPGGCRSWAWLRYYFAVFLAGF